MRVKKVIIKNFRGISSKEISFDCSDYNALIGDNGTSKTTILEAINLCLSPGYSASKLGINDFHFGKDDPIKICVYFDTIFTILIPDLFGNTQELDGKGIALIAKKRDRSAPGRAFNDLVVAEHLYIPVAQRGGDGWIIKRKSGSDFQITERQLALTYSSANYPKSFYFDKTRSRQLKKGYGSTISSVIDDLNWRFEKKQRSLDEDKKFRPIRESLENYVFDNTDGHTLKNTIQATNKTLAGLDIKPIELSLIRSLNPYDHSEVVRHLEDSEISLTGAGSGVEMIIALVFLLTVAKISKDDICIIIDEPEMHLHPSLQDKLARLLLDESSRAQVFVSTHSPFFFKNIYEHNSTKILITEIADNKSVRVIDAKTRGFGLLDWSPSWGEICYFAYKLPTMEFHDDLYASIQDKNNISTISATEGWFISNGEVAEISWNDASGNAQTETLMTYIRNRMHHGDNQYRPMFTEMQLKDSIQRMIGMLQ